MKKIFAAVLLAGGASASNAQVAEQVGIQAGTRLRVSSATETGLVGSLARATADTVQVIDKEGRLRAIPASQISAVQVSRGRPVDRGRVVKGFLLGTAIVGGLGATAIAAAGDKGGDAGYAWMGLALVAPIGGIVGGIWAARTAPEVWESVPIASLSTAPTQVATIKSPVTHTKSRGKKMAIGALVGGALGGFLAASKKSANPAGTRFLLGAVPGVIIGGAIGAF